MNVTVEKLENCKAVVKVIVDAAVVKSTRDKILRKHAQSANLPGFRPGKAPISVVEKRLGDSLDAMVRQEITDSSFGAAVQQEKLEVLAVRNVEPKDGENGALELVYNVDIQPAVKLPLYKGLKLNVKRKIVDDAAVDKFIVSLQERLATFQAVERGAQAKDMITIDYTGTYEDKPLKDVLEEGNHYLAENLDFPAVMTESSFVPGFYEKLLGAKVGDSLQITVTMPEDAGVVAGKEVSYAVVVKKLEEPILPELNDEFAAKFTGGKNLDELKTLLKANLENDAKTGLDQNTRVAAVEALRAVVDMDLPESSINSAAQRRANELVQANLRQGLDMDSIRTHTEEIIEAAKAQASLDVKDEFILQEIARAENLVVSNEELSYRVAMMASSQQTPVKKLVKDLQKDNSAGLRNLQYQMMLEKAVSLLVENAEISYEDTAE